MGNPPRRQHKKTIVLIGGGHSHALLALMWAKKPLPNTEVLLISPQIFTPYSGMLPGLIAGHYTFTETHIDLSRLCAKAGIRFVQDAVHRIDVDSKQVFTARHQPINADLIVIDCGATPNLNIPGAPEFVIPVKPIADLYSKWQQLLNDVANSVDGEFNIGVVGGGAAGVELVLAMAHRFQTNNSNAAPTLHLIHPDSRVPVGYPRHLQNVVAKKLAHHAVQLHNNFYVDNVGTTGVVDPSGKRINLHKIFWCTQAAAAEWPKHSGIDVNPSGFIKVDAHLRSTSHPWIFAAGDIADFAPQPLAKAGVYAVRQAPVLFRNLQNAATARHLEIFKPQKKFLSLLACGDRTAVGGKYGFTVSGAWVWRWKNFLDKQFMNQFD